MDKPTQRKGLGITLGLRRSRRSQENQAPLDRAVPEKSTKTTGWVSSQNKPQQNPQNDFLEGQHRQAAAKGRFETALKNDMKVIQQAKQFALTVDGERIRQKGKPSETDLTNLSVSLQNDVRKLDEHSKKVRPAVEEKDFILAESEFNLGLKLAREILEQDKVFQEILKRHEEGPVLELAGSGPLAKGLDFRRRLNDSRSTFEDLLETKSDYPAVKDLVNDLRTSYDKLIEADESENFDEAEKLLSETLEYAEILLAVVPAAEKFAAEVQYFLPHMKLVWKFRKLRPTPEEMENQVRAADAYDLALKAAEKGDFAKAVVQLDIARKHAELLIPDGATEGRIYEESWESVKPRLEQSRDIASDSPYVKKLQEYVKQFLVDIPKLADEGNYEAANMAMEDAANMTRAVSYASRSWEDFLSTKDFYREVISAATTLKVSEKPHVELQNAIAESLKKAESLEGEGKHSQAITELKNAYETSFSLLGAIGSTDAVEFYREHETQKKRFEVLDKTEVEGKHLKDLKASYDEAREYLKTSVAQSDFFAARSDLDLCETRAYPLEIELKKYRLIDNFKKGYKQVFELATKADPTLEGVAAPQLLLADSLKLANAQIDTDLDLSLKTFKQSLVLANKVNGAVESHKKQRDRKKELDETIGMVAKSYMPTGFTENLKAGTIEGEDTLWDFFLVASEVAEKDRDEVSFSNLESSAKSWLAGYNTMEEEVKQDPKLLKRKQACETAMKQARHLKLAVKYEALGDLPWDQATEDKAADLFVQVLFETGERPMEKAGEGAMGAKWVMSTDFEKDEGKREFIFKEAFPRNAPEIPGFIKGSEAPREVMGDELGKQLKLVTGIDFNVPETRLVNVDNLKLEPERNPGDVLGSAQAGVQTVGSILDLGRKDPKVLKKIPAKSMQKAAIFDALALNLDRHTGNFLVTPPNESEECELVPIDNGLAFPTRLAVEVRRGRAAAGSAFNDIPSSFEPFDPESLAAIEMIDEDELVQGLKSRKTSMDNEHPSLKVGDSMPDEAIDQVKRRVQFMKAAAPRVSPGVMMDLILENAPAIYDTPEVDKMTVFNEIIEKGEKRDKEIGPLVALSFEEKEDLFSELWNLGWNFGFGDPKDNFDGPRAFPLFKLWSLRNPREALRLAQLKKPNSKLQAESKKIIEEIKFIDPKSDVDSQVAGLSVGSTLKLVKVLLEETKEKAAKDAIVQAFKREFPNDPNPSVKTIANYRLYSKFGAQKYTKIGDTVLANLSFDQRWELLSKADIGQKKEAESIKQQIEAIKKDPAYLELQSEFDKYQLELRAPKEPEGMLGMIRDWIQLKALGGIEAFVNCGGDYESVKKPSEALRYVLATRSTVGVDLDA
ncbi:MAG: phosphatidylinositol 4-kinase [Pirellula sp.]|nr:phosphatidylinositol 4-kinase [Pirellula sp.]